MVSNGFITKLQVSNTACHFVVATVLKNLPYTAFQLCERAFLENEGEYASRDCATLLPLSANER